MDNGWLCGDMETIRWLQIHKMSSPTAVFWVSDNQSTNHTAQVLDICRRGNRSIPRDQERDPNFSIKDIHFPFHIVEAFPFSLCVCAYAIQPTRLLSSIYRVKYSMVLQPAAWEVESISCLTLADTHIHPFHPLFLCCTLCFSLCRKCAALFWLHHHFLSFNALFWQTTQSLAQSSITIRAARGNSRSCDTYT
jgi:hypothetical protein